MPVVPADDGPAPGESLWKNFEARVKAAIQRIIKLSGMVLRPGENLSADQGSS